MRICFVGDSITAGTGDSDHLGWPGRLAALETAKGHDVTLYNLGIRGDTSTLIADRWERECGARLPDIHPAALVFMFGVNDAADLLGQGRRVSLDTSLATAAAIFETARTWRPSLWIGPTPVGSDVDPYPSADGVTYAFFNDRIEEVNQAFATQADERMIPYLDLFTDFQKTADWDLEHLSEDRIHPSAVGYERMARAVESWPAWRYLFDGGVMLP